MLASFLAGLLVFLLRGDLIFSVFTIIIIIIYNYSRRGLPRTIAAFTWSMSIPIGGIPALLLSVITAFSTVLAHKERGEPGLEPRSQAWLLTSIALFYLPLLILNPLALFPYLTFMIMIIIKTVRINYKLLTVEADAPIRNIRVAYGEEARIPIIIKSFIRINYIISLDGKPRLRGGGLGAIEEEILVKPRILGETSHTLNITVYDEDFWTSRSIGPINIKIKTTLESIKTLLRIRKILLRYREYITTPLVYKVRISLKEEKGSGAAGTYGTGKTGYGPGAGGTGQGGVGLGGGEAGSTSMEVLSEPSEIGEKVLRAYFTPLVAPEGMSGKWSFYGDYSGAREYLPGDRPKDIHWKKSISKQELIVKVYEPGSGGGGGGERLLIIADWTARNPEELDELIKRTYSAILSSTGEKILFLRTPTSKTYLISGSPSMVLLGIDHVLKTEGLSLPHSYQGWKRESTPVIARRIEKAGPPLSSIAEYFKLLGSAIAESLKRLGVKEGTSYYIINSDITSLRNYYIGQALSKLKLTEEAVASEEWDSIVRRILAEVKKI